MTEPIPYGYNFKVNHKRWDNHFAMATINVYGDIYGIGYMISGDRMIITPDRTVFVHPGNVQFMHRNLYHRTTWMSEGLYDNMDIKFRESVAEYIISVIGREQFDMLFEQINVVLTPEASEQIGIITALMEQEWNRGDQYFDAVMKGLVLQFFVTALRGQAVMPESAVVLREKHLTLVDALHYVQLHYAEDPSLQQTARAVHVSSAHLSRLFKSEMDTTYSNFLTEVKLTHARRLLLNTELSVSEIAGQCGYQNSNYFSDIFKKQLGCSPLRYKKSMLESVGRKE